MFGRIVGLISGIMCALPFFIISIYDKDGLEPINFWSGDTTLKSKVKNIPEYNKEMAALYKKCAYAFLIMGVALFVLIPLGIVILVFNCTLGIYLVWRVYKKILERYS